MYSFVDGLASGSSGESCWLIFLFYLSMGLQTPSTPLVPSLTSLLGTPHSVQWLAASILLCICQALAEPLRRQLYQAPVSKYFLASTIVSICGMDPQVGQSLYGLFFSLCSTLCLHISSLEYFVPPSKKD